MMYIVASVLSLSVQIDSHCQALVDAHSQMLERIRTINVEYTVDFIDNPTDRPMRVQWTREGRKERIRRVAPEIASPDGRPLGIYDLVIDGATYKWLQNWDPENPQKITPSRQGSVKAFVAAQRDSNAGGLAPSQQLLFEIDAWPRRTLAEMTRVSPAVSSKGKVTVAGRELWLITLETPEESTATTTKRYFEIYLDAQCGYMIRKLVVNAPKVVLGNGKTTTDFHVHEVVECQEFEDGIFVPTSIRIGTGKKWVTQFLVQSIEINETIPPESFEMKWPKFAAVVYEPTGGAPLRTEVWGDGRVLKEFVGTTDLSEFEAALRRDPLIAAELGPDPSVRPPLATSSMTKLTIALAALVAIVAVLIVVRRVREQRA